MTVDETLAIQKLKDYVEDCDSIERAKKICRAFLKKYGNPDAERIRETFYSYPTKEPTVPSFPKPIERYNFQYTSVIDPYELALAGKEEYGYIKQQIVSDHIQRLGHEMLDKGYVHISESLRHSDCRRTITTAIGAYKL